MYIKEVILDGFKSYAQRTVVGGFDPQFNAITGLNGSGKSNILDSICFVLGISNLSQGQAHVNKASVTIVFDNSDKQQSPIGYHASPEITVTREIVVNGKNKYIINGTTVTQQTVQNLFHSVQLNVNNPHFLIMQGRITKVLNMKPPEILAMIEEAAGTRMFEMKKQNALKTIMKKQHKVDEINKVLSEEITPQLEKLRKECMAFNQYQSNEIEIERLQRFCVAAAFFEAEVVLKKTDKEILGFKQRNEEILEISKEDDNTIASLAMQIKKLSKEKFSNLEGNYVKLEDEVERISRDMVKHTSEVNNLEQLLETERNSLTEVEATEQELCEAILAKEKDLKQQSESLEKVKEKYANLNSTKTSLEGQQLGFNMSGNDENQKGSLVQQQMAANSTKTSLEAKKKSLEMQLKNDQKEVNSKRSQLKQLEREFLELKKQSVSMSKDQERILSQLSSLSFSPQEFETLTMDMQKKQKEISRLTDEVQRKKAQLSNIEFNYQSRRNGAKIHGRVVNLFSIKDGKYSTALEVAAGGRLFHVVVDTEETGKEILKCAKLNQRINIIPLNRVNSSEIPGRKIQIAQQLVGQENVCTALSCVEYEAEVEAAIKFALGGDFICSSSDKANIVAFNRDILTRTVTYEGDLFNPAGTLTGGSRPTGQSILQQLNSLRSLEEKLHQLKEERETLASRRSELNHTRSRFDELKQQEELLKHKLHLSNATLEKTDYRALEREIEVIHQRIDSTESQIKECITEISKAVELAESLQKQLSEREDSRENVQVRIEKELKQTKKELEKSMKSLVEMRGSVETIRLELESLMNERQSIVVQKSELNEKINSFTADVNAANKALSKWQGRLDEVTRLFNAEKQKHLAADSELRKLQNKQEEMQKKRNDMEIELKKLGSKMQKLEKEREAASQKVKSMHKQYKWISDEHHLFGKSHTDYDFAKQSPSDAAEILNKKKAEQTKLGKSVNKAVVNMKQKAEEEYKNLMSRREIIEKDKHKIEEVIEELDQKKNEALFKTWQKVNKDFGSIFSTLLPGTTAKLEPPEGCEVLDGLEVKVAFGSVWKESLSELSGGQRSLLALSLILALLLYKPAPMYILDEVDAALDLSHTQNIGRMLKTHFSQSQFIVVSLKDGMFNNANVLFRTKFVDGVSTVSRTVNVKQKK